MTKNTSGKKADRPDGRRAFHSPMITLKLILLKLLIAALAGAVILALL